MTRTIPAAALAALALLALAACSDDSGRFDPTVKNLWPHAEGSAWTYTVRWQYSSGDTTDAPPSLPTFERLHADLVAVLDRARDGFRGRFYTFALAGDTTTPGGLPAQVVEGTAEPALPDTVGLPPSWPTAGYRMLGGQAIAFREDGVVRVDPATDEPAWVYLAGDLVPGAEFTHTWTAGPDSGRTLRARVWSVASVIQGGVLYTNVVECLYLLELGTDTFAGTSYPVYSGGRVWYAQGVGPLAWQEQRVQFGRVSATGAVFPQYADEAGTLLEADLAAGP